MLTASAVPRKQLARKRASATKRTPTTVTSYTTDFISLCYVTFLDKTSDAGSLPFLPVSLSGLLAYLPQSFSYASSSHIFIIPVDFSDVPFPFTCTYTYTPPDYSIIICMIRKKTGNLIFILNFIHIFPSCINHMVYKFSSVYQIQFYLSIFCSR